MNKCLHLHQGRTRIITHVLFDFNSKERRSDLFKSSFLDIVAKGVENTGNRRGKSAQTKRSQMKGTSGGQIVEELSLLNMIAESINNTGDRGCQSTKTKRGQEEGDIWRGDATQAERDQQKGDIGGQVIQQLSLLDVIAKSVYDSTNWRSKPDKFQGREEASDRRLQALE
ncbi:predicted protein [Verticillium alfalfae VaMs.102]|uniref:Predicted protein n=1 Tax=Verticillium alfalfae (strain VaMs.102 / ATCC MYA-4576 / FGSC 10136) TaxID=526221 RepID=C9SDS8_VERA1|nr:predicted protein [Verticillium alfalfae VaMs.102]EEY17198.1 predicted protein [Verticillium alfalfae VaMs.102]